MSLPASPPAPARPAPPSRHQLALMIWIAVFPTLTALNLTLGPYLSGLPVVLRTLVLVTIAVPIVIYGLMPRLHRARGRLLSRRRSSAGGVVVVDGTSSSPGPQVNHPIG